MKKTIILLFLFIFSIAHSQPYHFNSVLIRELKKGAQSWNKMRKTSPGTNPLYIHYLRYYSMSNFQLKNINLDGVNLSDITFSDVIFDNVKIRKANLKNFDLNQASNAKIINTDFSYSVLDGATLSSHFYYCNFSNVSLKRAKLEIKILKNCNFYKADMEKINFITSKKIINCNFQSANLKTASFQYAGIFDNCNFKNAQMNNAEFRIRRRLKFTNCNFTNVDFRGVTTFYSVEFINCDFAGAKIHKNFYDYFRHQKIKNFDKIDWQDEIDTQKYGITTQGKNYLNILKKGTAYWNKWREQNNYKKITIKNNLVIENFNLDNVNFKNVDFQNILFYNCSLNNAVFTHSNLRVIEFRKCKLNNTTFYKSELYSMRFYACEMNHSSFKNIKSDYWDILNCNLNNALFENIPKTDYASIINIQNCSAMNLVIKKCELELKANKLLAKKSKIINSEIKIEELNNSNFEGSIFNNIKTRIGTITKCNLDNSQFINVYFWLTDFNESSLHNTLFRNCSFEGRMFLNCNITNSRFINVSLKKSGGLKIIIEKKWYHHLKRQNILGFHLIKWK